MTPSMGSAGWSRHPARHVQGAAIAAGLVLTLTGGLAFTLVQGSLAPISEQAAANLASEVQRAVNAGDAVAMEAITASGVRNDYRWVREWRSSGNARPWNAGTITVPGSQRMLIQVSRPQVVQSTNDRLYEVTGSGQAPRLGREVPEYELVGCRITHHRLRVELDARRGTARIADTASMRVLADHWNAGIVRLNALYRVTDARLNDEATSWRQHGGFVVVPKPRTQTATLTLHYEATLPRAGETFMADDEAALTAYWYAHTGRLPATSEVEIVGPRDWLSIAPGEKEDETIEGDRRSSRWKNDLPVSFISAAAGRYHVTQRKSDGRTLAVWLLHHSVSRASAVLDEAEAAIRTFHTRIAPFPYSGYTVVESDTFPPALEAYSFTLCGSGTLPGAVAHEVSHTWWGGLVPNTYTRSMWNEAFATYSEWLHRRLSGDPTGPQLGQGAREAGATLPDALPLARVTDAMNSTHAAIGYGRGARVLEQLERMIGTSAMLDTLRAFVSRHKRGEAADWADYRAAVAATMGADWEPCLDAWLDNLQTPAFVMSGVTTRRVPEGYAVAGNVTSNPPGFWALIPIVAEHAGGLSSTAVLCRGTSTPFRLVAPQPPRSVVLDPDGLVLRSGGEVRVTPTP